MSSMSSVINVIYATNDVNVKNDANIVNDVNAGLTVKSSSGLNRGLNLV